MNEDDAPFSKLHDAILSFALNDTTCVAISYVRLEFECHQSRRKLARLLEIAVKYKPDMPRRRLRRAIRTCAWQSLTEFYEGHDPLDQNLFLESDISEDEELALYRDLQRIEVEENLPPMKGRLLQWVQTKDAPPEVLRQIEHAA